MTGFLKVFTGPMFSSKSTALIEHLRRAKIANKTVILFKPSIDQRYSVDEVVSHNGEKLEAVVISTSDEIAHLGECFDVVGVDEVQFFDTSIINCLNNLANNGKEVIVAGLNADYMGNPFETTALAVHYADKLAKLTSVCKKCGEDAVWTQMMHNDIEITDGDRVQVGGLESYEPRCRGCFVRKES